MTACYAHSLPGKPPDEWQPLEQHLRNVATLAKQFAEPFGGEEWGYLAGLWHDLGKYSEEFQAYLRAENGVPLCELASFYGGKVEHAFVGALHAAKMKQHLPLARRIEVATRVLDPNAVLGTQGCGLC
jgi:CRISPR-associated endonuclease/helicase Cas3